MSRRSARRAGSGFTLVELLVSLTVVVILVLLLGSSVQQTAAMFRRTTGKTEQFREARAGFEAMTSRLAQATLNTYWDYQYDANGVPVRYTRQSELRFISGPSKLVLGASAAERPTHCVFFQAPLGITEATLSSGSKKYAGFENLLCTWGYYLEYASDRDLRPGFLPERQVPLQYRHRLLELWQPAEKNRIYLNVATNPAAYSSRDWFSSMVNSPAAMLAPPVHVLAENIIALLITPRLAQADEAQYSAALGKDYSPLAPDYIYDSSPSPVPPPDPGWAARKATPGLNPVHQLPPLLQVTMVALEAAAAQRLNFNAATRDPFQLEAKNRFLKTASFSKDLSLYTGPDSLEADLIQRHADYRIFTTSVVIRGAKWSRDTVN